MLETGIAAQLDRRRDRLHILESLVQCAMRSGCDVLVSFTPRGEVLIGDGVPNGRPLICSAYGYSRAELVCMTPDEPIQVESKEKSAPAVEAVSKRAKAVDAGKGGRPRKQIDTDEVLRLRLSGLSFPQIASRTRLGMATVHRAYQAATALSKTSAGLSKTKTKEGQA